MFLDQDSLRGRKIDLHHLVAFASIVALFSAAQESDTKGAPGMIRALGIQVVNGDGHKVLEIGSDPFGGYIKIWECDVERVSPRPGVQLGTSIVPGSSNLVLQDGWNTAEKTRVAAAVKGSPGVSTLLIHTMEGKVVKVEDLAAEKGD